MNRMTPARAIVGLAIGLGLIAGAPAQAKNVKKSEKTHSAKAHSHKRPHHAGLTFHAAIKPLKFSELDGWQKDDTATAFATFMKSCGAILQGSKADRRARPLFAGLYNACERGKAAGPLDSAGARKFFEANFKPMRVLPPVHTYGFYTGADGFFTGYYETEVAGSRFPSDEYKVPLYRPPAALIGKRSKIFSQYDRKEIVDGALAGRGLEICWVKDPVSAFFAEIQGSTRVKLDDGSLLRLNYIASNGKPYTPVGKILIEEGIVAPQDMTMDKIREYMEEHPKAGAALRLKDRSYVFFSETPLKPNDECIGAQGVPLTPWRSVAVDSRLHIYGVPIWIDAKFPIKSEVPQDAFQHLMVAQDTGAAIRGPARADIYFGHGHDATHIAGRIKQFGKFVMLVPKDVSVNGEEEKPDAIPLPRPRPKGIAIQEAMAKGKAPAVTGSIALPAAQKAPLPKPRP
jgi:membrane-bound lytic murein transglycosylase A